MDEKIIRYLQGRAQGPDERELRDWRAASPANEARFRELEAVWERTDPLLDDLRAVDAPTLEELLAGARAGEAMPSRPAAARVPARRRSRAWTALWAAAVAGACLLGFGAGRWSAPQQAGHAGAELVTSVGERATVELEDGSVVRLGPESRLRLLAGSASREVWLDGRAFFAIAKQDGAPFRVRTRLGEAVVLGTRFELDARDRALQVVVVEGSVAIGASDASVTVDAGKVGRVDEGGVVSVAGNEDVLRHLDWAGDFLAFQHTPLGQVAIEVARRFDAHVVVADSALLDRTVSGWYVGTDFRQTMEAICLVIGARCAFDGETARVELESREGS